jgi:ADP-heptose:LPS heptosyltransferase
MPEQEILHLNRPGAAGDIIITLQAVEKYKKLNPNTKIIYYCDPFYKDLPCLSPAVNEVRNSSEFNKNLGKTVNFVGYTEIPLKNHLMYYFGKELGLNDTFYSYGFKPVFSSSSNPIVNSLLTSKKKIITLHCTAGWSPYKNWDMNNWQEVIDRFNKLNLTDYIFVQLGAKKDPYLKNVVNVMDITISESVQLIKTACLHLGVDSFSNHATALLPYTPSIILWGSTHPMVFGYGHNVNIWRPLKCSPCYKVYDWITKNPTSKCPLDPLQTYNNPQNPCMTSITVDEVLTEILKVIDYE